MTITSENIDAKRQMINRLTLLCSNAKVTARMKYGECQE